MKGWISRGLFAGQIVAVFASALLKAAPVFAGENEDRWWPTQALPKVILRTANQQQFPEPRVALQMMVQSVAGLAAKAVNESHGNELIWVDNGVGDLEKWYARLIASHPELATTKTVAPWELVDHFTKEGLIKGYILYRSDRSQGENNVERPGMNCSVNVATSLAGLLDGVMIDEDLEQEAKAHGLKLLLDAREKSQLWCFQTYKGQFNRRMVCFQDPRAPHVRDLAIAQKVFTTYGSDQPTRLALAWLEPLSPVLGWNCGDEFANTDLSSGYGEIQTASNWSLNLPVLMAGTEKPNLPKAVGFDPRTIDWEDSRSAIGFISTDGDNLQWLEGNFFGNASYWGNPERGKIPFGWSACFAHLTQVCPQAIDYALATRSTNDWFIEWGGGYYYPDRFGRQRTNRWELLARQARRTWGLMRKTNERIVGFNFSQLDSPEAHKACEVFASQTDGLLAIFAFQYAPYEAGAGKIFWVRDGNGMEVPVITARYSIWEHANNRDRAGTPAKVAREIQRTVEKSAPAQLPHYDWVISHVWSFFKHTPGNDENAENMPQENAEAQGGVRGYSPVVWCAERLPSNIRVVNPEELVWRIRMKHDPSLTKKLMSEFK
jgi:putative glycoside hydrolase with GxGYxYP motif/GxGYxY motif-containing protein